MTFQSIPWVELAVGVPLFGAVVVSLLRDAEAAFRWCLLFSGITLACTVAAAVGFQLPPPPDDSPRFALMPHLFGREMFGVDILVAPLLPAAALLHFLTALATERTKLRRFSFASLLIRNALITATFTCQESWGVVGLLAVGTIPPLAELIHRGKPTRVYVLHMTLFVVLLVGGWALAGSGRVGDPGWTTIPLLIAVLLRSGVVPLHCWLTDLFEHDSFGGALLFVLPISGVFAAVRLVLPVAPDWALQALGVVSLVTAVYTAGLALVQKEARRFFAYLFLSHASLIMLGLELHTTTSLTGALCLWFSVMLSLGGFGLTLRALEARHGRLSLADYHGLYRHSPTLAVCFLLTGLASVGFPGTLGFVSGELLVDGAVAANPYVGVGVVLTGALNGIAVLRAYFLLFTGRRYVSTVSLSITTRERFAVLTLAALILGGGLYPQPGVDSRHDAAETILEGREPGRPLPGHPSSRMDVTGSVSGGGHS